MATADTSVSSSENSRKLREEWIERLSALMNDVRLWAGELGWSTRAVPKPMRDTEIGSYEANGLVLQKDYAKVLMDPIARSAPGLQGVVDFYLMPGLDDIASLYFYDHAWHLHYAAPDSSVAATVREAQPRPLTKEALGAVLQGMTADAL